MSSICQIENISAGGAYPKSCPTCGISGKCVKGLPHPFKKSDPMSSNTTPAPAVQRILTLADAYADAMVKGGHDAAHSHRNRLRVELGAALSVQPVPDATGLHAAIMNLPCKPYDGTDAYTHYCRGHRDARHAAAELALGASPAATACSGPAAPEPEVSALRVPPAGAFDAITRYEIRAHAFHAMTLLTAPGKDMAAAAHDGTSYEEREAAWNAWNAQHGACVDAVLRATKHFTRGDE